METDAELVWKSAVDLTAMMKTGQVSASEVLDAHLDHIAEVNPKVNAIVTIAAEHGRNMAAEADRRQAAGEELGLLHGLPIAHKDLANTAGIRTTHGSPLMADHVPTKNDLIVERAVDAGAVTMGKTNTPEFGAGSQTFNAVFGETVNPYDTTRTCGGSSGGAAVALATGMVPIADGSDMGGSLRNPASFCNVVGLRPSPGRVPAWPKANPWSYLSTEGPMARSVDDCALLLAAQAGPDARNPIALETPGIFFAPPIAEPTSTLRVAWAPDLGGLPVHPDVTAALAHVPQVFDGLGHCVEDACPDLTEAGYVFDTLRAWSFATSYSGLIEKFGDKMKETVRWNVRRGMEMPMAENMKAWKLRGELYQRSVTFFEDYDFLLCPVAQVPPFDVKTEYITEINGVELQTYIEWMRIVTDVTIMNCPAISVPARFTEDGLPIGLQIVGPPRSDRALLEIAKQFETATNVGARRPVL
ncbi:MAG: hypothetical protein KC481_10840 [Acidimicrobiaceae bacterium]|nr:hypothetical protein [Acidimicrobiaceae bacterium]